MQKKNADIQELLMKQDVMNCALLWEKKKKKTEPVLSKNQFLIPNPTACVNRRALTKLAEQLFLEFPVIIVIIITASLITLISN